MIIAYTAILVLAILPIYAGAYASLKRPASAPPPSPDEVEEESFITEGLRWSDAIFFPLLAGCMLGGLYLLITYVSKEWVNWLLNLYMLIMGFMSNTHAITRLLVNLYPPLNSLPSYSLTARTRATEPEKEDQEQHYLDINVSVLYIFTGTISLSISAWYAYTKNWIASNMFGLAFAFNGIQLIALDSFRTGMILLTGLFLYDIYFVFGTEIMITVAQGIEAPIKIVFPRDVLRDFFGPAAMLGLGDIVLPGVYCALCLRYDLYQYHKRNAERAYKKSFSGFAKPYFHAVMVAYVAGLASTIAALHIFKAAQPALLYLSPACIVSSLAVSWHNQDMAEMWSYQELTAEELESSERKKA